MEELNENDVIGTDNDKGWFTNVLSSVSSTFSKFIILFKKNGILYTLLMMILFIVFWSLIINPIRVNDIIEKRLEHQWQKELKQVEETKQLAEEKRYNADALITPIMEDIVEKFNVDRALLFEAHNSTTNISGIDFLFYSSTYEVVNYDDYNLDYIGDNFQRQYISNMIGSELMTMLRHKDYLTYSNLSNYKRNKSRLLTKLNKFGVQNTLIIPIKNNKQQPILLLVICHNDKMDAKEIYEYFKQFEKQIEQSLIVE